MPILEVFTLRVTWDGYVQFWTENINIELLNISVSALGETAKKKQSPGFSRRLRMTNVSLHHKSNNFSNCLKCNQTNKLHDDNKDCALWGITDVGFNSQAHFIMKNNMKINKCGYLYKCQLFLFYKRVFEINVTH